MQLKNTRRFEMAKWISVLFAAVAVAACSDAGGDGSEGTGGNDLTGGSGVGTGAGPSGTGAGAVPSGTGGTGTSSGGSGGNVDISTPDGNPFTDAVYYINPDYVAQVQSSIDLESDAALDAKMEKVKQYPTAVWLDRIAKVDTIEEHLARALEQQEREGKPVVTVFVVYDLPNRDCNAKASNGELKVAQNGIERYKTEYIDRIAQIFSAHPNQRIVAIVEPDSLPNIATNLHNPYCVESAPAYRECVAYAVQKLTMPHVYQYLDVAHSGWLGWQENQNKIATIFKEVLESAGGVDAIRGFATNVSNYTQLTEEEPEIYPKDFNPCAGELDYVSQLTATFNASGLTDKKFIIDTSRNGVGGIRRQWGYWCNNVGAGLGERPAASPTANVDAYFWVKPPGESDGTADHNAERFDEFCAYENAAPGAPEAGTWFHSYFVDLVRNADPAL